MPGPLLRLSQKGKTPGYNGGSRNQGKKRVETLCLRKKRQGHACTLVAQKFRILHNQDQSLAVPDGLSGFKKQKDNVDLWEK